MIQRKIEKQIRNYLFKQKAIIIYGARQVGKTTLVNSLVKDYVQSTLLLNGDDSDVRTLLSNPAASKLKPIIGKNKIVVIDEAQRIPETGLVLKIIHDNFKEIQLIATGSSAFELANKIKEPLTGRKFEFNLFPFSFDELVSYHGFLTEKRLLEHRLIFGYYPDIALSEGLEQRLLKDLTSSYLYKDLLMLEQIQKPFLLEKILKALALQIGNEVSFSELSVLTGSDNGTIEKYIDLLEKAYIIFRLNGLNRNVRNEIKKGKKIYFYDNGIRNAIIGNFLPITSRVDSGALWENFLVSERIKFNTNNNIDFKGYFWRTTQQQEIDYIEERNNSLHAFEFKWNANKKVFLSKTFSNAYPGSTFNVISPETIHNFLLSE
ncbi:MAG: ATP-binding protein [Bacteroidales bacterium]|jgi:predicted AAA+ superfamily ATPase|nr:ATP-binding protein [Bacteroidales bacterium]